MESDNTKETYYDTPLGVARDTKLLICKCRRVLSEKVLIDDDAGNKACPDRGTEKKDMSLFLTREGVPSEVEDTFGNQGLF